MNNILWITYKRGISQESKVYLQTLLQTVGLNINNIFFITLDEKAGLVDLYDAMNQYEPAIVVCQDHEIADALGKPVMKTKTAAGILNKLRGSVYHYQNTKVIILAQFTMLFGRPYGRWLFLSDLSKVSRWYHNKPTPEPQFRFTVVNKVEELAVVEKFLARCDLISIDIETPFGYINCIGFSGLWRGAVYSFILPLINPLKKGNLHWQTEAEHIEAWSTIKRICANDTPKVFQNGNFDNSYLLKYNVIVNNWLFDTYHMWHCIFQDIPKSIDFICSITLDNYRYWKDEAKGDDTEEIGKDKLLVRTMNDLESYWRYNGLDCHNTLLACLRILQMMKILEYPVFNYSVEMNSVRGPALFSTMHGFNIDKIEQINIQNKLKETATDKLKEIKIMTAHEEFNPSSPEQVSKFLYEVLGCPTKYAERATKKKKTKTLSTDKRVLQRVAEEHPLYDFVIKRIFAYKEAQNNISKYGKVNQPYRRLYWRANAGGTKTWRQATSRHHFNTGTNAQNIPQEMRTMLTTDVDWYLFDFDFSQSDFYYIAHESEDPLMIETAVNDRDTHLQHTEAFFKIPYEKSYKGYKEKDPFYSHPVKGVRQLTKHITHAATGGIGGHTMYNYYMGKSKAIQAAKLMGHEDADTWSFDQFVSFCGQLMDIYYSRYYVTKAWRENYVNEIVDNNMLSRIGSGMTRKIFGNVRPNSYEHRDVLMWNGQGGTSYAINRTLNEWFYGKDIDKSKCQIFLQVHDSVVGKVRKDGLGELAKLVNIMERPITIKGREFYVPAEGEVGFVWGKGKLIDWHKDICMEEIEEKAVQPTEFVFEDIPF